MSNSRNKKDANMLALKTKQDILSLENRKCTSNIEQRLLLGGALGLSCCFVDI